MSLDTQYKTAGGTNTLDLSATAMVDVVHLVSAADSIILGLLKSILLMFGSDSYSSFRR